MTTTVNPTGKTFSSKATVKVDYSFGHAPIASDDSSDGFAVGSEVMYLGQVYVCADATENAAVWNAAAKGDAGAAGASGNLAVVGVSGTSDDLEAGKEFRCGNAAATTLTLPATAAVGDEIRVTSGEANTGGFVIAQNASQYITYLKTTSTVGTGGSIANASGQAVIHLKCTVADNGWEVIDAMGEVVVA